MLYRCATTASQFLGDSFSQPDAIRAELEARDEVPHELAPLLLVVAVVVGDQDDAKPFPDLGTLR